MKHMPSVQEDLLRIFSERLIPWARQTGQPIVLGRLPLRISDGLQFTPVQTPLLKARRQRQSSNVLARWPDKGLAALRIPHLGCIVEGEADLRLGMTEAMFAEQIDWDSRYGQAIVTLPARSWVLIPPGVPQSDGTRGHREPGRPPVKVLTILWINVLPEGVILHTCQTVNSVHTAAQGLFARGTYFARIIELMSEELEADTPQSNEIVRSLMLAFLLSIEKTIAAGPSLTVANPEHLSILSNPTTGATGTPSDQAVERALRYISAQLHKPLHVKQIAAHAYVSAPQLNRLFRSRLQASVMEYVTQVRIQSACSLLRHTELSVREISDSLGYSNRTYFSRVFIQQMGVSPTAFRRGHRSAAVSVRVQKS